MSKLHGGSTLSFQPVCSRCLLRLSNRRQQSPRWASTARSITSRAPSVNDAIPLPYYFFANDAFKAYTSAKKGLKKQLGTGFWSQNNVRRPTFTSTESFSQSPSRRRASSTTSPSTAGKPYQRQQSHTAAIPSGSTATAAHSYPQDASSRLSSRASKLPSSSTRRLLTTYLALSKPRLTFLMVLTAASAYSLYPEPELLSASATASPSLSALTLVFLTSGTALCSGSANALNMLFEYDHDAKMSRTRNRPLVRGLISTRGALLFAVGSGLLGTASLYYGVNPTVAFLGASNILLYAGVYTPLKRTSVINTWVGAVVGAIPPLMGWAAAAGQSASDDGGWRELLLGEENIGGWLLASLLFAWQFPHFNALSWSIRDEYKAAGYRMMCWVNERRNARVALRYAVLAFPICAGLVWVGVVDRGYLVTSSVVNSWIVWEAYRFWKYQGHKGTARALFWAGVWQLPVLMVLAMLHKKGLWDEMWRRAFGEDEEREAKQKVAL